MSLRELKEWLNKLNTSLKTKQRALKKYNTGTNKDKFLLAILKAAIKELKNNIKLCKDKIFKIEQWQAKMGIGKKSNLSIKIN